MNERNVTYCLGNSGSIAINEGKLASCTRKWNIFSTNRRFVKGMKLKASWLLRKAVLFSILLTKMGHFLGNNDKLCLSCFLDIAHFFEVLIIDEAIFEMFHLSSLPKKERKTFFLYIFLSLKEMHNNKLLCYIAHIFDMCIR